MKLLPKRFRVLNYRNIDDSNWIPLERVTALVGRNESGPHRSQDLQHVSRRDLRHRTPAQAREHVMTKRMFPLRLALAVALRRRPNPRTGHLIGFNRVLEIHNSQRLDRHAKRFRP